MTTDFRQWIIQHRDSFQGQLLLDEPLSRHT